MIDFMVSVAGDQPTSCALAGLSRRIEPHGHRGLRGRLNRLAVVLVGPRRDAEGDAGGVASVLVFVRCGSRSANSGMSIVEMQLLTLRI